MGAQGQRLRGNMEYCRTHTFSEWIEQRYAPSVWERLKVAGKTTLNAPHVDGIDFVMRFERLQHDFDEALRQAGITQALTIPRINETANRDKDYRRSRPAVACCPPTAFA